MTNEDIIRQAQVLTENKMLPKQLENLCLRIVDSLIKKFGKSAVQSGVKMEANSEVNNVLTHVLEVGSIKCMKDLNLISGDDNALMNKSFAAVLLVNSALGRVLHSKGMLANANEGYYGRKGMETIGQRVFKLAKIHQGYHRLSESQKNDTFSVDELFAFYLGDFMN